MDAQRLARPCRRALLVSSKINKLVGLSGQAASSSVWAMSRARVRSRRDDAVELDVDTANERERFRLREPEVPRFGDGLGWGHRFCGLVMWA